MTDRPLFRSVLRPETRLRCLAHFRPRGPSWSDRPFRRQARSPQVRTLSFTARPPDLRRLGLGHRGFAVLCLLPARRRLVSGSCPSARGFVPGFLPTLGRPRAVAVRFAFDGLITGGLSPPRQRPCWAHIKKPRSFRSGVFFGRIRQSGWCWGALCQIRNRSATWHRRTNSNPRRFRRGLSCNPCNRLPGKGRHPGPS